MDRLASVAIGLCSIFDRAGYSLSFQEVNARLDRYLADTLVSGEDSWTSAFRLIFRSQSSEFTNRLVATKPISDMLNLVLTGHKKSARSLGEKYMCCKFSLMHVPTDQVMLQFTLYTVVFTSMALNNINICLKKSNKNGLSSCFDGPFDLCPKLGVLSFEKPIAW